MSFSQLLNDKLAASGKTLAEVAETIQVSLPSLRGALNGKSLPNKRSLAKYAGFLAISEEDCANLVKEAKAAGTTPAAKGKRKGGRKAKAAAGKPGPKKAGRKAKGGALSASLANIADAIQRAEAVLADELVMQLYALSGAKRKAAEAILVSVL